MVTVQVFHGILQQVNEPVYDDFLPEDQIVDSALFHEKDMVAMFNDPEHHESEHRVVMDVLKPQYDMFFQDPFADLLYSFNGGVCYVMNVWSQELMKVCKSMITNRSDGDCQFPFSACSKKV
jgi:hypothetical protein